MSEGPFSDTAKKNAKALKKLAEDELGKRPPHSRCLRIVASEPRTPGEPREVYAARLFEKYREELAR